MNNQQPDAQGNAEAAKRDDLTVQRSEKSVPAGEWRLAGTLRIND